MESNSTIHVPDRNLVAAWRRDRRPETLRPIVERYAVLIYAAAYRQTGSRELAEEVTGAVFQALTRRARREGRKRVLAGWLFRIARLACRKLKPKSIGGSIAPPTSPSTPEAPLWDQLAPNLDRAIHRLSPKQRDAVLLRIFLNWDWPATASMLGISERRAGKRVERGLKKLTHRLNRKRYHLGALAFCRRVPPELRTNATSIAQACSAKACAAVVSTDLVDRIIELIHSRPKRPPTSSLARRLLVTLAWRRWIRRILVGVPIFIAALIFSVGIAWQLDAPTGHSRFIATALLWQVQIGWKFIAEPARPWPTNSIAIPLDAREIHHGSELYRSTNIWLGHLRFTPNQWQALEPRHIGVMPNFLRSDGLPLLRNPKARRSGALGVIGYEFDWSVGQLEFGGLSFTNVGVRGKGNLGSLYRPKRSLKVDLNREVKGQKLVGLDELAFNNLIWDYSCLNEALGYEFYRDAGVPASRTAYAWLSVTVDGKWVQKPLGLYLLLEPVDSSFAEERFGSRQTPIFKPVTYNLWEFLGDDWQAYAPAYDLKTKATREQLQRVIDFSRLVSFGTDAEFGERVGAFVDLVEFAGFMAGQVLVCNYDGILTDGQNFYMYLDPHSNKFGFIPWDLDSAWGNFWIGSREELERASIWHPWVGENRFLKRMFDVESLRKHYRAHLEDYLTRLYSSERLQARVAELATAIHGAVAAESSFRLKKFEREVGLMSGNRPSQNSNEFDRLSYPLEQFVEARAKSVREQLDGKSEGVLLRTPAQH